MKTIILIQQSIKGMNLVSMIRESSSELLNGTFKSWLENNWGHLTWEHSKGDEGSDSIEYKSGNYTATYTRIMDGDMNDENTYSPMRDDSLTFIEEVVPMAEKDEEDEEYETENNEGTMTEGTTTAIFFEDMKEEAQKRIIAHEMADIIECEPDEVEVANITIEDDCYGYDEDPDEQELLEHVHADINGEEWLMVWDCFKHEFPTVMKEHQKV